MKKSKILKMLAVLPLLFELGACGPTEAHVHDYSNWEVTKEPTCLDKGEEKAVCSTCGKETTKSIPSLGHDMTEWAYTLEPTCTTSGMEERHCTRCDKKNEERKVEAFGHRYSDYVVITEATCVSDGLKKRTCSVCGDVDEVILPKLGHVEYVSKKAKEPTCETDGNTEEIKCSRCNEIVKKSEKIPALRHNYSIEYEWAEDGTTCFARAVCQNNESEIIEERAEVKLSITKEPTCTESGEMLYEAVFQNKVFTKQTASMKLDPLGHDGTVSGIIPSTCIEKGKTNYHCKRCNLDYSEELPLAEHTPQVILEEVKPTCLSDGKTSKIICSYCKKVLQEQTVVKALGHNFEVIDQAVSSCTKGGVITKQCTRCGEKKSIILEAKDHVDSDTDSFCDNCGEFLKAETAIKITSAQQLTNIRLNDADANYVLEADIELNGFVPIGDESHTFNGIFYGNGHILTFKGYDNNSRCGIFYRIKGRIDSLHINPGSFSTTNVDCKVGFITMYNSGMISNCKITGDRTYRFKTEYNIPDNQVITVSKTNTFEIGELVYTNEENGKIINCKTDGKITMNSDTNSHHYLKCKLGYLNPNLEKEAHLYVTMNENFSCLAVYNFGEITSCDVNSPLNHTGKYEIGTNHTWLGNGYCSFTMNQCIASVVMNNDGSITDTIACKFKEPNVTEVVFGNYYDHTRCSYNYKFDSVYSGMITNNNGAAVVTAY